MLSISKKDAARQFPYSPYLFYLVKTPVKKALPDIHENLPVSEDKPVLPALSGPLYILAIIVTFSVLWLSIPENPAPTFSLTQALTVAPGTDKEPRYQAAFVSAGKSALVHASSAIGLPEGKILAVWFGGSREGAGDVTIEIARFDPASQTWSGHHTLVSRASTQAQLQRYIRKLGNPVITRGPDGRLWVIYVSVSLGGWATANLNIITSTDEGKTWQAARRIITSPFLNLSTLVRGTPYFYSDGSMALPIYHEMAGKFGELLRLAPDGTVLDKQRLDKGRQSLQPVLFPVDEKQVFALMRYAGEESPYRALSLKSEDGGRSWSKPRKTGFENPNSALTGMVLNDGAFLVVANDTEDDRDRLSLLISTDQGNNWRAIYRFEDESAYRHSNTLDREVHKQALNKQLKRDKLYDSDTAGMDSVVKRVQHNLCAEDDCRFQFDYPYLIRSADGDFHLIYTWNKSFIKHIRFNRQWLEQQL